mmetsp:Transcript_81959/g.230701  ORF Transcript_81959/g.230701 Transcript_81959/m.230701 type:complete len:250 (+) Transcript_81959:1007-1756(+)
MGMFKTHPQPPMGPGGAGPPPGCIGIIIPCCGGGGLGAPMGQPFKTRHSLIRTSVLSMSPTMVTVPTGSWGTWSILMSAPLLARMSLIVSPPLPMSARTWRPSSFRTLNLDGCTPGGGLGPAAATLTRSCSQSGTSLFGFSATLPSASRSHFDRFRSAFASPPSPGAFASPLSPAGAVPARSKAPLSCNSKFSAAAAALAAAERSSTGGSAGVSAIACGRDWGLMAPERAARPLLLLLSFFRLGLLLFR